LLLGGSYGVDGIAISMPTIVGRNGIEEMLTLPISDEELMAFRRSAHTLKERFVQLATVGDGQ